MPGDGGVVRVSILIATLRRSELLAQTLASLGAVRRPELLAEILLVDNAGDEPTQRLAAAMTAQLPIRLLVERVPGKNRALNRAVPDARGDLLAFVDDDIVVDPGWLAEMVEGAARWPEVRVFGGRILPRWPAQGPPCFDHPFFRHAYAIADWPLGEGPYSAGRVFGGNMAIRRSVVTDGWRFSPDVGPQGAGAYVPGSETELTLRLERAGDRCVYLPRALVHHQIRPEQLRRPWLYGRAFRKGRADFHRQAVPDGLRIAGVPVMLWRRLVRLRGQVLRSRLTGDAVWFDRAIAYSHLRGVIHECRVVARRGGVRGRDAARDAPRVTPSPW